MEEDENIPEKMYGGMLVNMKLP